MIKLKHFATIILFCVLASTAWAEDSLFPLINVRLLQSRFQVNFKRDSA